MKLLVSNFKGIIRLIKTNNKRLNKFQLEYSVVAQTLNSQMVRKQCLFVQTSPISSKMGAR